MKDNKYKMIYICYFVITIITIITVLINLFQEEYKKAFGELLWAGFTLFLGIKYYKKSKE